MTDKLYLTGIDYSEFSILLREIIKEELQFVKSQSSTNDFLTVEELCNEFKMSKQTVYTKVSAGVLPHFKNGKRLLFSRHKIAEWINTRKRGAW